MHLYLIGIYVTIIVKEKGASNLRERLGRHGRSWREKEAECCHYILITNIWLQKLR